MEDLKNYSLKMYTEYINNEPYARKKDIIRSAKKYLESFEGDDISSKENVLNFLSMSSSVRTFAAHTARLKKFFSFCVSNKIIDKNPFDEINQYESDAIKRKVDANVQYVAYDTFKSLVDDRYKNGKIIDAIILYALFEGITLWEIGNLKEEDICSDGIVFRDNYHLRLEDTFLKLLNEFISMDEIVLDGGGSRYDFTYLPLVKSKYVLKYTMRTNKAETDAERASQAKNHFYNAKVGFSAKQLMESGFLHHVREKGLDLEDITRSQIMELLQQYGLSWSQGYDILRKGL